MSLAENLVAMERSREMYWRTYGESSPLKLKWRAITVRHCFHVLPGETILEIGAGSGLWTEHLVSVLRSENPITAAVFNKQFADQLRARKLTNVKVAHVSDLSELPDESFDYVIGTAILCHTEYARNLKTIHRLLKPGGQLFFFEANYWNPQVFLKCTFSVIGRMAGHAECQIGMRKYKLLQEVSHQGYSHIHIVPYDIIHPLLPSRFIYLVNSLAYIFEHTPIVRELSGTLYLWAKKPGNSHVRRRRVELTPHGELEGSISVVVPCRNEEMNVGPLADALLSMYEKYILEIIFVNDGSDDRTADVVHEIASRDPRVRLINRAAPNGLGCGLKDGYACARGRYILSMDCDFVEIVPELRDLFDAITEGFDGAIGSRFSHESVLINYPFIKILCNRLFHLLARTVLRVSVRDISNNLKLFRTEVLQSMDIQAKHFAANAEIGLKAVLAGYRVKEVPISWINRSPDMGRSSFQIGRVAPGYLYALIRILTAGCCGRRHPISRAATIR